VSPDNKVMTQYHGTSKSHAEQIIKQVDVDLGGGELGKGFYTGDFKWAAVRWAFHKYGTQGGCVVEIEFGEDEFCKKDIYLLSKSEAIEWREKIKQRKKQRTFSFGKDVVWAPIVGTYKDVGDQMKWESTQAEEFLNDPQFTKKVIVWKGDL